MTTPADRVDGGVRVLIAADAESLLRELARTGCTLENARVMTSKGQACLVRLTAVPNRAATLIKQEMLACGGDAALHDGVAGCAVDHTDIVLVGSEAQVVTAVARLHHRGGLAATADAIFDALFNVVSADGVLRCGRHALPLGQKTYIMGILNVTPDSFSGDGLGGNVDAVLRQAEQMVADGADLLDIGGESTRPGADEVSLDDELQRVVPAVRALAARVPVPISVDTYKSSVARAAVEAGATMINDISGLRFDPAMAGVAAEARVPVVVMHIQGTPRTMQQQPVYADLMSEICAYLEASTALATAAGVAKDQVILDPGFGFGKTAAHNLELVRRLRELRSYGQPVLMGLSRKRTLGAVLGGLPPEERVEATLAAVTLSIANGADIVRVHDVLANARAAKMADALVRGWQE